MSSSLTSPAPQQITSKGWLEGLFGNGGGGNCAEEPKPDLAAATSAARAAVMVSPDHTLSTSSMNKNRVTTLRSSNASVRSGSVVSSLQQQQTYKSILRNDSEDDDDDDTWDNFSWELDEDGNLGGDGITGGSAGCTNGLDRLCGMRIVGSTSRSNTNTTTIPSYKLQRSKRKIEALQAKVKALKANNVKLERQNVRLEKNHATLGSTSDVTVQTLQSQCATVQAEKNALQRQLQQSQEQAELVQLHNTRLERQLEILLQQEKEREQQNKDIDAQDQQDQIRILKDEVQELQAQLSKQRVADLSIQKNASKLTSTTSYAQALEEAHLKIIGLESMIRTIQKEAQVKCTKLQDQLEHANHQLLELKEQQDLQQNKNNQGVHPSDDDHSNNDRIMQLVLNQRDETIAKLRTKITEYSRQLTQLTEEKTSSRALTVDDDDDDPENNNRGKNSIVLFDEEYIEQCLQPVKRQNAHLEQQIQEYRNRETKQQQHIQGLEQQLLRVKLEQTQQLEQHQGEMERITQEYQQLFKQRQVKEEDEDVVASNRSKETKECKETHDKEQHLKTQDNDAIDEEEEEDALADTTTNIAASSLTSDDDNHNHEEKIRQLEETIQQREHRIAELIESSNQLEIQLVQSRQQMETLLQEQQQLQQQLAPPPTMTTTEEWQEETTKVESRDIVAPENDTCKEAAAGLDASNDVPIAAIVTNSMVDETDEHHSTSNAILSLPQQEQQIQELTEEVTGLREQLRSAKAKNAQLRARLVNNNIINNNQNSPLRKNSTVGPSGDTSWGTLTTDETLGDTSHDESDIKERDDAISTLIRQLKEQEKIVSSLNDEIEQLNSNAVIMGSASKEVEKLKQEADVFACQVIELDEEIGKLRESLAEREQRIAELEKKLEDAQNQKYGDSEYKAILQNLEAEIDELKEANAEQMEELRELRKKSRQTEMATDEIARSKNEVRSFQREADDFKRTLDTLKVENDALTKQVENLQKIKAEAEKKFDDTLQTERQSRATTLSALQSKIRELENAYAELKASPGHISEEAVHELENSIAVLKQQLRAQEADLDNARRTIRELEGMLADKRAEEAAAHEEEREELLSEIESLTQQLEEARDKLDSLQSEREIICDFKDKLERADEAREESEKRIVDTYERKISLLTLDKDVTIDKLRNELLDVKKSHEEEQKQLVGELKAAHEDIEELRELMKEEVGQREAKIFALEHTLEAQEQLVNNMKTEMDHLQSSMESSAARRREEVDEMQQEILIMSSQAAQLEREIKSLQFELEAKEESHRLEVSKLQEKIAKCEERPADHRNAADLQMELRVKEVKDRLEKLKWRNTALKEENENLKERLEIAEASLKENGDYNRTKELEEDLSKQQQKVISLETEIKKMKAAASDPDPSEQQTIQPDAPRPPIPPSRSRTDKKPIPASPGRRLKIFGRKRQDSNQDGDSEAKPRE
jgi:DNA repair exonuclease SbcCD ATPase subunit